MHHLGVLRQGKRQHPAERVDLRSAQGGRVRAGVRQRAEGPGDRLGGAIELGQFHKVRSPTPRCRGQGQQTRGLHEGPGPRVTRLVPQRREELRGFARAAREYRLARERAKSTVREVVQGPFQFAVGKSHDTARREVSHHEGGLPLCLADIEQSLSRTGIESGGECDSPVGVRVDEGVAQPVPQFLCPARPCPHGRCDLSEDLAAGGEFARAVHHEHGDVLVPETEHVLRHLMRLRRAAWPIAAGPSACRSVTRGRVPLEESPRRRGAVRA